MPTDPRDYKLEIAGLTPSPAQAAGAGRPWLSVMFACCSVYQRVYQARDGSRYEGRCPKCCRTVRFRVGAGGTNARQFIAE